MTHGTPNLKFKYSWEREITRDWCRIPGQACTCLEDNEIHIQHGFFCESRAIPGGASPVYGAHGESIADMDAQLWMLVSKLQSQGIVMNGAARRSALLSALISEDWDYEVARR